MTCTTLGKSSVLRNSSSKHSYRITGFFSKRLFLCTTVAALREPTTLKTIESWLKHYNFFLDYISLSNKFYSWELFPAKTKYSPWNFKPIYQNPEPILHKALILFFSGYKDDRKRLCGFPRRGQFFTLTNSGDYCIYGQCSTTNLWVIHSEVLPLLTWRGRKRYVELLLSEYQVLGEQKL